MGRWQVFMDAIFVAASRAWVLMGDQYVFPTIQALFVFLVFYAFARDRMALLKVSNPGIAVKRGRKSRQYFHVFYGFTFVVLMQIVNSTEAAQGHKTTVSLMDVGGLIYLGVFSAWFRNKIVGWFSRWEERRELHAA